MKALVRLCCGLAVWAGAGFFHVPAVSAEDVETATRQYMAAVAFQNRGVYDLAAEEWTKFIKSYPADSRLDRAQHYLGVCHLQANQLDAARQCFETVVKSYPKFESMDATLLYLGVTQFRLARGGKPELFDAAAATLDTLIKNYPKSKSLARALFTRGDCAYYRDRKDDAVKFYSRAVVEGPDEKLLADILYALGVTEEELKRPSEAAKAYDDFLKKYPESPLVPEVVMRRGETLLASGQQQPAAEWFANAAARKGFAMADLATLRQAVALGQLKKYDQAGELLASIPAKFPGSKQIEAALKECDVLTGNLLEEKRPAEALALVEKMLAAAGNLPQAAPLVLDRADAVAEIPARRGEAVGIYAAVATKYPKDPVAPQALYSACRLALAQGDFAAAQLHADAFRAAYAAHKLLPDATYVAAEARLGQRRLGEAEKLYAELIEKYPQHADAETWKVRRAIALHLDKKYKEAVAWLRSVVPQVKDRDVLAEAQYLLGTDLAEQNEFGDAATALEASLAARPKWRQAYETLLLLGHVYYRQGSAARAKETLQKLTAEFSESKLLDRAHFRLAEYAAAGGDPKTAAAEYRRVANEWPQDPLAPRALYGLGWALFDQNDFAGAEAAQDTLVTKYPQHALVTRARYARGIARHQLGKFAEAAPDLAALLGVADATPAEKTDARYVLGLCQVELKKPHEAAATFRTLLKEDPNYASADKVLYKLAWALRADGKEAEAVEVFAQLVKQCPASFHWPESQFHVGEAAYKAGKFQAAATAYAAALDKAGKSELGEKAAHKLGWTYFRLDNAAEAQRTFRMQRDSWPRGPLAADAAFMEAECLFQLKKYPEALAAYQQAKGPSSKDFQALVLLHSAEALGLMKAEPAQRHENWQKALDLLDQAVKDFPDSPCFAEMLYERGWALQNLDKLDEAAAEYDHVLTKTNGEAAARAQFMIGEIQFQQKRHAEAVKSFFRVIYGYGYPQWQADACYEAARCFEVLQKKSQAVKQYQELIDRFPASDKAPLAKERIKALQP
ncbi:MAG: tetratricopeptide repeat protein [Thermoguttaceae bacterium]